MFTPPGNSFFFSFCTYHTLFSAGRRPLSPPLFQVSFMRRDHYLFVVFEENLPVKNLPIWNLTERDSSPCFLTPKWFSFFFSFNSFSELFLLSFFLISENLFSPSPHPPSLDGCQSPLGDRAALVSYFLRPCSFVPPFFLYRSPLGLVFDKNCPSLSSVTSLGPLGGDFGINFSFLRFPHNPHRPPIPEDLRCFHFTPPSEWINESSPPPPVFRIKRFPGARAFLPSPLGLSGHQPLVVPPPLPRRKIRIPLPYPPILF